MTDTATTADVKPDEGTAATGTTTSTTVALPPDAKVEVVDPDAGAKTALDKERAARKESDRARKTAEAALVELRQTLADKEKPAEEVALENARREGREEATKTANAALVRAELKAAATGKVKNPALALKLVDTSAIEVNVDGEVDSDALNEAITKLITDYPELAADGSKFSGTADQGAKDKASRPTQISETELARMKAAGDDAGIVKARAEGRLDDILGIKN
jgi:hypothetical protein